MIRLRFEKFTTLYRSAFAFALLFMSACATQQTNDTSIDEQIEIMKQIENVEENSASKVVPQDMGLLSLHERNEKEALKNLQNEVAEEQLRIPANQETQETVNAEETKETASTEIYTETEEVKEVSTAEVEASNEQANTSNGASWSTAKIETLSKDEMSQELFEAESVVVQKGDSLSALAEKHLGNKKAWARIWSINPNIQNPNVIEVGTKIYVPKADEAERSLASTPEEAPVAEAATEEAAAVKTADIEKAPVAEKTDTEVAKEAPLEVTPVEALPKIQDLAPEVKAKAPAAAAKVTPVASSPTPTTPVVSTAAPTKVEETKAVPVKVAESKEAPKTAAPAAATVTSGSGSSHTTDELLAEHLDSKRAINFKGKDMPSSQLPPRKISSVNDSGPDQEVKAATAAPKALNKLISFAGLLILAAVLAGFFFSKPKNQ